MYQTQQQFDNRLQTGGIFVPLHYRACFIANALRSGQAKARDSKQNKKTALLKQDGPSYEN